MSAPDQSSVVGIAAPTRLGALVRLGPEAPSVVFNRPSRGTYAVGLGVAVEGPAEVRWLEGAPAFLPPGPCFGGWAFDADRPWSGYPAERWFVPEVLASWDGHRAWLYAFGPEGTSVETLRGRLARVEEVEPFVGTLVSRTVGDGRPGYLRLVQAALDELDAGRATKLVPARVIEVEGDREFPERAVLKALEARFPTCCTFLIRGADGSAFVGASPESLCDIAGVNLGTEALAGTAPAGHGEALRSSDKDLREHAAVVSGLREALAPWAEHVDAATSPQVRDLANVSHLWTPLQAQLRPGVDPLDVARALHPTPAVAGGPQGAARAWLAAHEGFARGWYAGAFGTRNASSLSLVVTLRSAWLQGRVARVFAGAGVVSGSTPEGELAETTRKAEPLLRILGVSHA